MEMQEKIVDLFGVEVPGIETMEVYEPSFDTPDIDSAYNFQVPVLERLLKWWRGGFKIGLFATGPTGCGKTTLFEQFVARLGADIVVVPCHGGLEMADLIGKTGITKDGSTEFQYGAGVQAMRSHRPTVLMFDELNFVPPNRTGLLNRLFDGKPLTIDETGEVVRPMPHLRLAATGNAVERGDDSPRYRGTQQMNTALLNRCRGLRLDYMPPMDEIVVLNKAIPGLHPRLLERLVNLANDVRVAFAQGSIEVVMSTRVLLDVADVLSERLDRVQRDPVLAINEVIEYCLTDLARPEDRLAVKDIVDRMMPGLNIDQPVVTPAQPMPRQSAHRGATLKTNASVELWIHPNRGAKGPTYWGYVTKNHLMYSFNGGITDKSARDGGQRGSVWIVERRNEKETKGYMRVGTAETVTPDSSPILSTDEVKALAQELATILYQTMSNQTAQVPLYYQEIVRAASQILPR